MKKLILLGLLSLAGMGLTWIASSAQDRPARRKPGFGLIGDLTGRFVSGISGRKIEVRAIVDGLAMVPFGEGGRIGLYAKGLPWGGGRTVLPVTIVLTNQYGRWIFQAEVGSIRIADIQQVTFEIPATLSGEFEVQVGVRGWLSEKREIRIERY